MMKPHGVHHHACAGILPRRLSGRAPAAEVSPSTVRKTHYIATMAAEQTRPQKSDVTWPAGQLTRGGLVVAEGFAAGQQAASHASWGFLGFQSAQRTSPPVDTSSMLCRSWKKPPWKTRACPAFPLPASLAMLGAELAYAGAGRSSSPIGTMGVPPSVFISMPVSVCTSNSGLRLMKNSGLPQPVHETQSGF